MTDHTATMFTASASPAFAGEAVSGRVRRGLFGALCLYGLWSAAQLAERWGASPPGFALLAGWLASAALAWRARSRPAWIAVGVTIVAWRLGSGWLAAGRWSPGDSMQYLLLARHLLAGDGLVVREAYMGVDVRGFYPPAYPLLLAGWGAVAGVGTASLLVLSALIDGAAAVLIERTGRALGCARAARAAALYLLWPPVVMDAPLAAKEGLGTLLAVALALGWVTAARRGAAWRIGLPAAALALCQPGLAPLAGLWGLALMPARGWRTTLRAGVSAALVAGAAMVPWWLRNWAVFGRFVPLTTASGLSLWVGSHAGATGGWEAYPARLRGLDELAYAQAAGRIARDWIVAEPLAAARLWAGKLVRALTLSTGGVERLAAMRPALAPALLLPMTAGAQALLTGGATLARRRPAILLALVAAGIAQLLLFALPFELAERHRMFLTPFLLLLALG